MTKLLDLLKNVLHLTGAILRGIDTSHHQGAKNWPVVLGSGKANFVYVKLSEGETYTDPHAEADVLALRQSSTPWGGYHFFRPTMDIQAQAQNFWRLGQYALLPPWLDVEPVKNDPRYAADLAWWTNTPKPQIQARIKEMLDALEAISGVRPIIYSADWVWKMVGVAGWEPQYRLAVASYTATPVVPAPWTEWTFWQFSASGIVPGINKPVDLNYFNGTMDDLMDLCGETPAPPPGVIAQARVLGNGLRVRKTPWGTIIRALKQGDIVNVYEIQELDTWARIGDKEFVCVQNKGTQFLELSEPITHPVGFDAPVGTVEERATAQTWPGDWFSAQGYLTASNAGWHTGDDLNLNQPHWDADAHAPVYSISNGVVVYAETVPAPSTWGGLIVIRHDPLSDGRPVYSRYGHVENILVQVGNEITRGQQIAQIGQYQGGDPNYHLHFDISNSSILGDNPRHWPGNDLAAVKTHYVDPAQFLQAHRVRKESTQC